MTLPADVELSVNYPDLSPGALTDLYTAVGWNAAGRRTPQLTGRMLRQTFAHVCAYRIGAHREGQLVGFGRAGGDVYGVQILDLMTRPEFQGQGIGSAVLRLLLSQVRGEVLGVSLIDGSGRPGFYERFGFEAADANTDRLMYLD